MNKGGGPSSVSDNLVQGTYVIMRKMGGYNHFHFLDDDFMLAQYFILIDFINKEAKAEKDAVKGKKNS